MLRSIRAERRARSPVGRRLRLAAQRAAATGTLLGLAGFVVLLATTVGAAPSVAAATTPRTGGSYVLPHPMPGGVPQAPSAARTSRKLVDALDLAASEVFQFRSPVPLDVAYSGWHTPTSTASITSIELIGFNFPHSVTSIEATAFMQGAVALMTSTAPVDGGFCASVVHGLVPLPDVLPVPSVPSAYELICPNAYNVPGVNAVVFAKGTTMGIIESTALNPERLDALAERQYLRIPLRHAPGNGPTVLGSLLALGLLGWFVLGSRWTTVARTRVAFVQLGRRVVRRPAVRFMLVRLGFGVLVMIAVSFATTMLAGLLPGSAGAAIYPGIGGLDSSYVDYHFGFDNPLVIQYWHWLVHAFQGNLGNSLKVNNSVVGLLKLGVPITAEITVLALVASVLIAVPAALVCAARPGGPIDRLVGLIAASSLSMPVYVSGVFIVDLLAVKLRWFPNEGWTHITVSLAGNLRTASLPVLTLTLTVFPFLLKILRDDLVSLTDGEFVVAARCRGLPEWYVLTHHMLRPAAASFVTYAGIALGTLVGGSFLVETFYVIPGLGFWIVFASGAKDITLLQGIVVVTALTFVVINTLVDVAYLMLDPRLRTR